jgi:hypothetical protein
MLGGFSAFAVKIRTVFRESKNSKRRSRVNKQLRNITTQLDEVILLLKNLSDLRNST